MSLRKRLGGATLLLQQAAQWAGIPHPVEVSGGPAMVEHGNAIGVALWCTRAACQEAPPTPTTSETIDIAIALFNRSRATAGVEGDVYCAAGWLARVAVYLRLGGEPHVPDEALALARDAMLSVAVRCGVGVLSFRLAQVAADREWSSRST